MHSFARRWSPAIIVMAVIFLASNTPGDDLPSFGWLDAVMEYGGHALGYALLAAVWLWGLADGGPVTGRLMMFAVLLAAAYGLTDEWHQSFVPGRSPDAKDIGVDAIGALLGVSAYRWLGLRAPFQRRE
jgi:VanZ family protein